MSFANVASNADNFLVTRIPLDICNIIAEYEAPLKLLDWINPDKIDWAMLSKNPAAIELLEKNPEKIDWAMLSKNPAAIELLKKNPEKIDWAMLSRNPEKINWWQLYANPAAIELIKTHSVELDWEYVCLTPTVKSMRLLKKNSDKINCRI